MATRPAPDLSIVIPAYNEEARICPTLERVRDYCRRAHPAHEVLVIDDGSLDGTAEVVGELAGDWDELTLIALERNRGKGFATRTGVMAAKGDWILCSDADLSTPVEEVERLLARGSQCPVVIGSRSIPGACIARPQPWLRSMMGRAFNWLARAAATGGYADTQCGFKLYRRDVARRVFEYLTIDGFAFDVEALYIATRMGYPICEVPVVWLNDERSTVSMLVDPLQMFVDVLRIRARHWRLGRPGT